MSDDKIDTVNRLLCKTLGKRVWGVGIGPAGVNFQLGEVLPDPPAKPHGEYSFWIKGAIKISDGAKTFFESPSLAPEELANSLAELLTNKTVAEAVIDAKHNALRIVLDSAFLFSAYPFLTNQKHYPWIIFDHSIKPAKTIVVQTDTIII